VDLYSSVNLRVLWLVLLKWSNGMGKPWPWFMWLTWLAQVGSKAQHLKDVQMPGHLSHYCQGIVTTPQPLISHCSQRSKIMHSFIHSFDCICWIKIHMTGTLLGTENIAVRKPKSLLHGKKMPQLEIFCSSWVLWTSHFASLGSSFPIYWVKELKSAIQESVSI
jgi:hypothetical protein